MAASAVSLSPSVPLVADDCPAVTGNTLAVAVDNEGHVATSNTDAHWAANDAKSRIIFGSTSEHQLALVANVLIADYYGRRPAYSYFDGCSDGGREALIEAQRYPHDFNGILAGAPANIWSEAIGEVGSWTIRVNTGPEVERSSRRRSSRRSIRRWYGRVARDGDMYSIPGPVISLPRASSATVGAPTSVLRRRRFGS